MTFEDRIDAGRQLGARLRHVVGDEQLVVVGLPRGGVPVAAEVAVALDAPLDVIGVRKLGVPTHPELAMGAIGEGDARWLDDDIVRRARVTDDELEVVERRERAELERRLRRFREHQEPRDLNGTTVIVVDDGIATGATARAACRVARSHGAARVVLATPVAPRGWAARLAGVADEFVAVSTPAGFRAVGQYYRDFGQTGEDEVIEYLRAAAARTIEPS